MTIARTVQVYLNIHKNTAIHAHVSKTLMTMDTTMIMVISTGLKRLSPV